MIRSLTTIQTSENALTLNGQRAAFCSKKRPRPGVGVWGGTFMEKHELVSDVNVLYVLSVRAGAVISCYRDEKGTGRHIHCCHQAMN